MRSIKNWAARAFTAFRLWLLEQLFARVVMKRKADFIVGELGDEYLQRWFVIPRNPVFNVYLHIFGRSDDARALHDHPWLFNASWLLDGEYIEHQVRAGGIESATRVCEGSFRLRFGPSPHRLQLLPDTASIEAGGVEQALRHPELPVVTLFVTGPVVRSWGFHCRARGWVRHSDWQDATGCGEVSK